MMHRERAGSARGSRWRLAGGALAGVLALAVAASPAAAGGPSKHDAQPKYKAKVTRTTGGIAHVRAKSLGDAGFGVGYAAAQDNLCTLADTYLTSSGERSRFLGSGSGNLASDFFWRSTLDDRTVERMLELPYPQGPSADAKAMAAGYAAGYNRHLQEVGGADGVKDPRCAGEPWVRPIETIDVWRLSHMLAMRASSMQYVSPLAAAAPPAAPASATRSSLSADDVASNLAGTMFDPAAEPTLGSNALGIGRDASSDGNGLVLGNPHFPWNGNERFWEFHLQVKGDLDVIGASLMGSPVVNIGHNRHVAWSHTVSTARRFTLFRLQLAAGDPTSYVVDGKTEPMRRQTVTVQVREADGTLSERTHTWYFTRYGRVTTFPQLGLGWSASTAYALGDANASNLRLFDQWLEMDRAESAQDLVDAQKKIQGIPWVNTIGADDRGNAFYTDLSVVPNVTRAKIDSTCVPGGIGQVAKAARLYLLDGSRGECGWGEDADAVQPGIFGPSQLPAQQRTDYVQNSNDSYWLTNPASPLTGFSPIVGLEQTEQGLRTRLGHKIVAERLAASDGLSARSGFTLDTLRRSWTADRNLGAELTLSGLRQICRANPAIAVGAAQVDVTEACPILDAYDGTGNRDSAGGWLFARWFANAPSTSAAFWTTPFTVADPIGTPSGLNTANAASVTALGRAVQELRGRGIALDATWGDVQHSTRGDERIPIPGCNTGCYPVTSVSTSDSSYGEVRSGSSFVMFAELDRRRGPRAQALLTYSQSEDPTSPFYADQTRRYSEDEWIDLPFRRSQIARQRLSSDVVHGTPPKAKSHR